MKIIKKIKRFLGLELPYLLEQEEETKCNTEDFNKDEDLTEMIERLSHAMLQNTMTANQARENLKRGTIRNEEIKND